MLGLTVLRKTELWFDFLLCFGLYLFWLEEPYIYIYIYIYIKLIFVGFSSIIWLVLGFGWKFRVKIGKLAIFAEIAVEYRC